MKFPQPLVKGTLVERFFRFLARVTLEDGTEVVAHVPNSGSMLGLTTPGLTVWLAPNTKPEAKVAWGLEIVELPPSDAWPKPLLVGVNTMNPNRFTKEAIALGRISELTGYSSIRSEVKYHETSRIDLLLEAEGRPACYVEIKNLTLAEDGIGYFPDAVTERGLKHLDHLGDMVEQGFRSVLIFTGQRADITDRTRAAWRIDPTYAEGLIRAEQRGVELLCYVADVTTTGIELVRKVPVDTSREGPQGPERKKPAKATSSPREKPTASERSRPPSSGSESTGKPAARSPRARKADR